MNAKELILKKINADTNWVDIYTSGVILGEDINVIGDFMTSQVINDLVSKYNTSAFDTEYVGTKIDFIRKAIASETDSNKIAAYNELLRRVYIAEELRILGKILKINQGMPTNFSDLQQYISSIEEYIESRLNHVNLENYQNTISQFTELKKRLGLSEELTKEEMNIPEVANALKQIKKAKEQMTANWIYFNLVKFVQDKEYAQQMDAMYEGVKVTFNILNTLRNSPHFSEMFNVLGLNNTILTSLSKRNLIERTIWNTAAHKSSRGQKVIYKKLNSTERSTLKTLVDDTLADTWIKTNIRNSDGSPVRIIWTVNEKSNVVTFDGGFDYKLFIKYIETELIPRLRNNGLVVNGRTINTADNAFIKHLTFGKDRDGNTIFRLPYNMTQIDNNPGIQMEYEKILSAFGQLRGIVLDNGLSIVDMFYLYNLIIHKDKINSRYSLTRLFEDLIASDGGEQLLVFKFNEWLETVNEEEIINKVLGKWGAVHSNDNIGNSNTSSSNLVITPKFDADKTVETTPKSESKTVKYTPKGQPEQTYTIIGNKIFNSKGEEVYADANNGHRQLIFVELALQENRAVKVEYRNVTYVVNDRNQIFSTSSNKIVYQNENDGNRRVILERAKEEFAKLQNMPKSIDINTISDKTEEFGVVFPKQGKNSQALKSEYKQWQIDNPTGIVAYRVKFPYNTTEEVQLGHIGNPFSENARGANTVQQFYDWLVTGNNFGNEKATDEYRRAIISKLLTTPANSPILYYTELGRPSHATVLGYLIANKQLLSNQSSPRVEIYQGYWTREEVESQTDKVFLFGDNTDDRVNTHYVPTRTQAIIRGLPNAIGIDTKKNRKEFGKGINIYSKSYYDLGRKLTNPGNNLSITFRGYKFDNAEHAYQTFKSGEFDEVAYNSTNRFKYPGSKPVNPEISIQLMIDIITAKFQQHPELVQEVEANGGLGFIMGSTHKVYGNDRFWEDELDSQGNLVRRGAFMIALIEAAKNVGMKNTSSYFTDVDFDIFKAQVDEAIQRAIDSGKTIVIPADGIGTGKAELDKRAPKLFAYLQQRLDELKNLSSSSTVQLSFNFGENDDPERFNTTEESVAEEPVTIGFNNTDERVDNEFSDETLHIDSDYIAEREEILRNASRNSEGQLLAPNGKVSKLNEEQWVTVRTKAFKEWFGDWTKITKNEDGTWNIPDDVSKVIDSETGEPKVVYHHTDNPNLTAFSTDFPNYFSQSKGGTKKAIFFDENPSGTLDRKYDIPVFLNIRNLTTYVGTKEDLHKNGTDYTTVVNESAARDARFGGLHMSKFDDNKLLNQEVWIIHDEHNVKSATGAHEFTSSSNIYDADPTPVYQTTPSKQSKLIEVVRQANEKGIKGLHAVYQSDLVNEDIYIRSANGFVRNGEIYINVDRAGDDTVIHEFGHLYLADAKNNNRLAYYALLEKVKDTELWKRMRTWSAYANKVGSDFDEEILATMIGEYYKSGFENYEYESLVKEALELVDPAFIELLNSEILPDLGDTFITNYHFQQKVATWKSKLVSDNILKENCL